MVNSPATKVADCDALPFTVYVIAATLGVKADIVIFADPLVPPKHVTGVVVAVPIVAQSCDGKFKNAVKGAAEV